MTLSGGGIVTGVAGGMTRPAPPCRAFSLAAGSGGLGAGWAGMTPDRQGGRRPGRHAIVPAGLLLLVLASCSDARSSFLDPAGPIAAAQRAHLLEVVAMTMIAILPVFVLVPLILWRYRYRNQRARYSPDWGFSGWLDLVMWGVPVLIIIVLSVMLWRSAHELDPYKPIAAEGAPLEVQVVGLDWKWLFIYPDLGIATVNELAFPVGASVGLDLTTDTVMQSFVVPALAGQIYAMPGMRTRLHLLADQPGSFLGQNTQWSGIGFTDQKFQALALSQEDFRAWVAAVKQNGVALDGASYARLATPSNGVEAHAELGSPAMPDGVVWFDTVTPDLFAGIIARYMQGVPVPPAQQPGAVGFDPDALSGALSGAAAGPGMTGPAMPEGGHP